MTTSIRNNNLFQRHVALPSDHGSWVFLLSPLLIGLFAGNSWSIAAIFLIITALSAFLLRQPITVAVKVYSGRRHKRDLPAAWFWIGIYGLVATLGLVGLISQGFAYLLILALPGIPVFSWHLYLVSRRAERRQLGVEIVASGVLALAAPAGYWIGVGSLDPVGWLLLALTWLQSAASIVYAYLRLEQRELDSIPDLSTRLSKGRRALIYTSFNLFFVITLGLVDLVSPLLVLPYTLQLVEAIWGTINPAIGIRPTAIGIRQLIISSLFTLLFILAW
ncbi:MAG: YwiC-like family protein [Chloroflexota bacterium]|nr:MAG: YwiC-like family protein [Chloroflexota bacterium]